MRVRPNSQNARILRALEDGSWVSVAEIHRRAGTSRLNSRISELRSYGFEIQHETIPHRKGALGHRYRLLNPPTREEVDHLFTVTPIGVDRESVPRDQEHRYRVYRMVYDELDLVATAPDSARLGAVLIELGRRGVFSRSCLGLLDSHGTREEKGEWIINPWDVNP